MLIVNSRIPVRAYPLFFLMAFLIGWVNTMDLYNTLIWVAVITVSVLVHEYGHALTAVLFGQTAQIDLVGLGGLTTRNGPKLPLWKDFFIVLNGPLAGFLLWILSLKLLRMTEDHTTLWAKALWISVQVNLFWTLVNLLPVQPLDGGHLLTIMMEAIFGFRGMKIAYFISSLMAVAISLFFFALQYILPGALFLLMAFEGFRMWRMSLSMTRQDKDTTLQELLRHADENISIGNVPEAMTQLRIIRDTVKEGIVYRSATLLMAKLLSEQGQDWEAFHMLLPIKNQLLGEGRYLLYQLACKQKAWKVAVELGDSAYHDYPSAETATLNAITHAALNQLQPTIGWLQRALNDGANNIQEVIASPEFNEIRNTPAFAAWLKKAVK